MTKIVASRFITRRAAVSQSPRERVVVAKSANLSQSSSTPSTTALVGAREAAFELQIVRRIGEDEIDASLREFIHRLDAVADREWMSFGRLHRDGASEP